MRRFFISCPFVGTNQKLKNKVPGFRHVPELTHQHRGPLSTLTGALGGTNPPTPLVKGVPTKSFCAADDDSAARLCFFETP